MKKVMTVFIDGLRHQSMKHMPFLSSLKSRRKIYTELGYSNTCHSSMYTGVYPKKHGRWFIWKYSPETSPFKWVQEFGLTSLPNNKYLQYIIYNITKKKYPYSSFFGLPWLRNTPLRYWPLFDVTEKKLWTEDDFIPLYQTTFDFLREAEIRYDIVGMTKGNQIEATEKISEYKISLENDWTYLWFGEVDPMYHAIGVDNSIVKKRLQYIDKIINKKYEEMYRSFGDFDFFCYSDHGHLDIGGRIDIRQFFRSNGYNLDDYIHLVEANILRLWFRNEDEKKELTILLSNMKKGTILSPSDLSFYNVDFEDNKYGDMFFILKDPYVFVRTIWNDNYTKKSYHGCLPEAKGYDGVFISNRDVNSNRDVRLEDILPTILNSFKIKVPDYIDGKIIFD